MNKYANEPEIVEALRRFYAENEDARTTFVCLAARNQDRRETTVERLVEVSRELNLPLLTRPSVINVLRKLDELKAGEFITGRHGHSSRIKWRFRPISIGRVATGQTELLETFDDVFNLVELNTPDVEAKEVLSENASMALEKPVIEEKSEQLLSHQYRLRPNLEVNVALPSDLTLYEAKKLADFVLTLPFEGQ